MSGLVTTLPNGFRVATEAMPGLESAALGVWLLSGSRHEEEALGGVAHFAEHMMFKGTRRRSALRIVEEIEGAGGQINAFTSQEITGYHCRILAAEIPAAADVLADMLRDSAFESGEIEVERGTILQEIGMLQDMPEEAVCDRLLERAYPDHPLGRPVIGSAEGVARLSRDDLVGFVSRQHVPGRMILTAAGAVDHGEIVRLATALFGDMEPGEIADPPAARFIGGEIREEKDLEQAQIAFAFECPGYGDPRYHAALVCCAALGGTMSSRLFQEARERRGLCYGIEASVAPFTDTGALSVVSATSPESIAELAGVVVAEMRRAAEDFTEGELERARVQLKAGLLMALESPAFRAERLARTLHLNGRIVPADEVVRSIDAVSLDDLRAMAADFAGRTPAAMALLGPVGAAPTLEALLEGRAG